MGERVLITGGAGFVGSHLADTLAAAGNDVVLFDNLEPQVHGNQVERPAYLDPGHRLVHGDIRDFDALVPLVGEVDVVVHLAAMVGVGQSMYQVRRYTDVNAMGMASLLEALAQQRGRVRKLLVASSMSIYGEGAYRCLDHGRVAPRLRTVAQLQSGDWEVHCPRCDSVLEPLATAEDKPLFPTSIYAINKRDHEEMALAFGYAYDLPAVALRFFNIYGSRQALSNPYTGVAAIFCGRMLEGQTPMIYEDGRQMRDFVHVSDIVQACQLAISTSAADFQVLNVGTGQPISVLEVFTLLADALDFTAPPQITRQFRAGDIRHCYADISRIRSLLGFEPRTTFADGVRELIAWVADQRGLSVKVQDAHAQLAQYGLVR
ncbi:MAG TPA: NAD-dependent epimerase/dehydratase family protein [Chloroflexota bacterium]|jgi:dTDP-L-rhamnose 4-epimerase|nr:NAD-dependent epimerase/dehydratase family protein [Chloroflexota bacterium]